MKKLKNIALFTFLLCIVAGCVENKMMEYEDAPAIYFHWSSERDEQRDSIKHSFFLSKNLMQDTVWVRINVMGKTAPVDRPIAVVQTNANSANAAIAGTHYLSFDSPGIKEKMVIPANSVKTNIPIVFLRHSSLELQEVRLELEVAENDYFRLGINKWRKFAVTTTAKAVKPSVWDSRWRYYFGPTWGTVKFRFIIEATGYTDWENFPASDMTYLSYMQTTVLQKFAEYNRDNPDNPLREANGDLVMFN